MELFKIRRKGTTDQFSTGGQEPRWSKTGKTWSNIGHVKSHLRQYSGPGRGRYQYRWSKMDKADYTEAEIVTFTMVVVDAQDVQGFLDDINAKKADERRRAEERARLRKEEREKEQLKTLRAKYPDE